MTALRAALLPDLQVAGPMYDRSAVRVGIVHVGVGGFHRSHEAMYVDRLLTAGHTQFGICGVGTQPFDRRMVEVLKAQDFLYTLVLKHPDGRVEPRVIGSIIDHLYAPDDPEAVIERIAAPTTHVVSLTITEGGYLVDPLTGLFSPTEPAVLLDLQPRATPSTVFGLVTEALVRRRARDLAPFTILSCDNIPHNGHVAREAFSAFAALRDPDLGAWVRSEVAFPSSMVDRITPVTLDSDRADVDERFAIDDGWPVIAEPYEQWVLEDAFSDGRPPWDEVGVQLVEDVAPYELMKLRLLNASHQAIGYLGYLAGYRYTDEVCRNPDFARFLLGYMTHEATPTLQPVPGVDLTAYQSSLLERFGNPYIRDTLARLCAETSDRIPTFLLPVIRDQLARGGDIRRSALVVAAWARYAEGVDEQGQPIDVVDRQLETIRAAAAGGDFLHGSGVFGDLVHDLRFVAAYEEQLSRLRSMGAKAAVASLPSDNAGPA